MSSVYNYDVSFETGDNGSKVRAKYLAPNVYEMTKEARKSYPDARMFIVVHKIRVSERRRVMT